jgi:transposase InsO family protein
LKYNLIKTTIETHGYTNIISYLCREAGVSRSGYYRYFSIQAIQTRADRERRDRLVRDLILQVYNHRGYKKGSRTIKMILRNTHGINMNRKRIQRIMRKYGIICPIRKANPYKRMARRIQGHHIVKNTLKRSFKPGMPFRVLLTDITYFRFGKTRKLGFLSAIKDSQTGEIVARAVSDSLHMDFVIETLEDMIHHPLYEQGKPLIIHSDQGTHYTSNQFRNYLNMHDITQSMSRRGNCWDNAPMESFFGTLKDHVDFSACETIRACLRHIDDFLDYYNTNKPQVGLCHLPPITYRDQLLKQKSALPLGEATP